MSFLDLLESLYAQRRRYLEDLPRYLRLIKGVVLRHDPSAKVFLFASYAEGTARPDSDVDVLIISDVLGKGLLSAAEAVDRITAELGVKGVFEIHVATRELFEKWYRNFIDVLIPPRCRNAETQNDETAPQTRDTATVNNKPL
jgi:predicted nucleotidyltransferase